MSPSIQLKLPTQSNVDKRISSFTTTCPIIVTHPGRLITFIYSTMVYLQLAICLMGSYDKNYKQPSQGKLTVTSKWLDVFKEHYYFMLFCIYTEIKWVSLSNSILVLDEGKVAAIFILNILSHNKLEISRNFAYTMKSSAWDPKSAKPFAGAHVMPPLSHLPS